MCRSESSPFSSVCYFAPPKLHLLFVFLEDHQGLCIALRSVQCNPAHAARSGPETRLPLHRPSFSSVAMSLSLRHASRLAAQSARQHSRIAGQRGAHSSSSGGAALGWILIVARCMCRVPSLSSSDDHRRLQLWRCGPCAWHHHSRAADRRREGARRQGQIEHARANERRTQARADGRTDSTSEGGEKRDKRARTDRQQQSSADFAICADLACVCLLQSERAEPATFTPPPVKKTGGLRARFGAFLGQNETTQERQCSIRIVLPGLGTMSDGFAAPISDLALAPLTVWSVRFLCSPAGFTIAAIGGYGFLRGDVLQVTQDIEQQLLPVIATHNQRIAALEKKIADMEGAKKK